MLLIQSRCSCFVAEWREYVFLERLCEWRNATILPQRSKPTSGVHSHMVNIMYEYKNQCKRSKLMKTCSELTDILSASWFNSNQFITAEALTLFIWAPSRTWRMTSRKTWLQTILCFCKTFQSRFMGSVGVLSDRADSCVNIIVLLAILLLRVGQMSHAGFVPGTMLFKSQIFCMLQPERNQNWCWPSHHGEIHSPVPPLDSQSKHSQKWKESDPGWSSVWASLPFLFFSLTSPSEDCVCVCVGGERGLCVCVYNCAYQAYPCTLVHTWTHMWVWENMLLQCNRLQK